MPYDVELLLNSLDLRANIHNRKWMDLNISAGYWSHWANIQQKIPKFISQIHHNF